MKYLDEYRDSRLLPLLLQELRQSVTRPMRIMEVCGSHTLAIFRSGLRSVLPPGLELISGPGCPVCVTAAAHIDAFIAIAQLPGVRTATFGDLFRVPGSQSSLAQASAAGAAVQLVYSPMDALEMAEKNPQEHIVFLSVGFETTTPGVAATILAARQRRLQNFSVFATQKTMPAPLHLLLSDPELAIDGLLCPGHVASIIGAGAFQELADRYHIACAVAGFESADLLKGLSSLARQITAGQAKVENVYSRAVSWEGNQRARHAVEQVFAPVDMQWRGLGTIAGSGLAIRPEFAAFDAGARFPLHLPASREPRGCRCGDIFKGKATPPDCPLFASRCTPADPVGPCMVSSEGSCAAYYLYAGRPRQENSVTTAQA